MKNLKSKLKIKQIVKRAISLLSAFLIGISTLPINTNTISAEERSTIVATEDNYRLDYIKYTDGNSLYFPIIRTNTGKYAFCLEHNKTTPLNITYNSSGTLDNGIKYILQNGIGNSSPYLLGNEQYDYYITQTAIKIYLGANNGGVSDTYMAYSTGDSRILGNARALANDARNRQQETRLTASITPASQDFYLNGDYFTTNNFTLNVNGNYTGYQVLMKGATSDVEVINSNTNQIMTNQQITPNTPFYLRIHKSKATQNLNIILGARIWYINSLAQNYIPVNSGYQRIGVLTEYPTNDIANDKATANLQAVGNVRIIKTSEDGVVSGITFNIQGNGINQNVTTGADGSITIPNLIQGTYTITETALPQYIEPQSQTITVTAGQTATVTFNNIVKKGNVIGYKVDEYQTKVSGATFGLFKADETNFIKENALQTSVSDETGKFQFTDIWYGDYKIKEIEAPQGYLLSDVIYDISIREHQQVIEIENTNYYIRGNVELYKVDKETGVSLNGAVFELYKDVNKNGLLDDTDTLIGNLEQENNRHYYNDLIYGQYLVKEKTSPNGYVVDKNVYPFSIINNGETITITNNNNGTFDNLAQKGKLKITKFGEVFDGADFRQTEFGLIYSPIYKNQGLKGTTYKIYANEDIYTADGTLRYKKGQLVDTITTNENGIATTIDLYIGKYIGVEWTATEDFVRNPETFEFEIKYAGQEIELTPDVELEFTNKRQKLEIELIKHLEFDKLFNVGLSDEYTNVFFGLFASEDIIDDLGNVAIEKDSLIAVTDIDKDNKGYFETEMQGNFYVKEITTDEHYILDETKYPVEFVYENQDIAIIKVNINNEKPIENKLKRGSVQLYKTDKETGKPINKKAKFELYEDVNNDGIADKKEYRLTLQQEDNKYFANDLLVNKQYLLVEKTAPSGYWKDENIYPFTISEDKEIITISNNDNGTFDNNQKIGKALFEKGNSNPTELISFIPLTSDNLHIFLFISLIGITGSIGIILLIKSRKNDKTK